MVRGAGLAGPSDGRVATPHRTALSVAEGNALLSIARIVGGTGLASEAPGPARLAGRPGLANAVGIAAPHRAGLRRARRRDMAVTARVARVLSFAGAAQRRAVGARATVLPASGGRGSGKALIARAASAAVGGSAWLRALLVDARQPIRSARLAALPRGSASGRGLAGKAEIPLATSEAIGRCATGDGFVTRSLALIARREPARQAIVARVS